MSHRANHSPQNEETDRQADIENHNLRDQKNQRPEISMGSSIRVERLELSLTNFWRLGVNKSERENLQGDPKSQLLWILFPGAPLGSHSKEQRKIASVFPQMEGGKWPFWKISEHFVIIKAWPQEVLFYQSPAYWGLSEPNKPGRKKIPNSRLL